MRGLLQTVLDAVTRSVGANRVVIKPQPAVIVGPGSSVTRVIPPARQAWDEKRWHRFERGGQTELIGAYRLFDRHRNTWRIFDGRIVQQGRIVATYIADPPVEVKRHRHAPCLQLVKAPWFRLHWNREPKTLDQALLYMERLLDEAINGTRG